MQRLKTQMAKTNRKKAAKGKMSAMIQMEMIYLNKVEAILLLNNHTRKTKALEALQLLDITKGSVACSKALLLNLLNLFLPKSIQKTEVLYKFPFQIILTVVD